MACTRIHYWTVTSLVSSYLKLVLAFILLWVASISFVVAKVLSIVGLHLPCSCYDSMEEQRSRFESVCMQGVLAEYPNRFISSVTSSVLHKFPFDSNATVPTGCCSSLSEHTKLLDPKSTGVLSGPIPLTRSLLGQKICMNNFDDNSEECASTSIGCDLDPQDKQTISTEVKNQCILDVSTARKLCCEQGICCLHCACASSCGDEHLARLTEQSDKQVPTCNDAASFVSDFDFISTEKTAAAKKDKSLVDNKATRESPVHCVDHNELAPSAKDLELGDLDQLERSLSAELDRLVKALVENGDDHAHVMQLSDIVSALERTFLNENQDILHAVTAALKLQRQALKAVYAELEKERTASASAADEALFMILRLQKEKASVEMELRQFKREAEETLVHDEQEIETLIQILVRREKEQLHLEGEVEAYRQGFLGEGDIECEGYGSDGTVMFDGNVNNMN